MEVYYHPTKFEKTFELSPEESRHCLRTMRHQEGDQITLTDGQGTKAIGQITGNERFKCIGEIISKEAVPKDLFNIHIAISPTKSLDRIEWFVEKAVEIGVSKISFIGCKNSIRKRIVLNRIQKKAISAMKQSGRFLLPEIDELVPLTDFIEAQKAKKSLHLIATLLVEDAQSIQEIIPPNKNCCIMIGPEGGFDQEEVEIATKSKFKAVKLGDYRLRTETAGIVACHGIQLLQNAKS